MVAIAAVVFLVAVVVPGHRHGVAPTGNADRRGMIDARGGEALTGPHPALPAVIAAGLRHEYAAQLNDGQTLHTTVDLALQRAGMRSLRHSLDANHGRSGAFVALDPQTGAIEAIGIAGRRGHAARVDSAVSVATQSGATFSPITALAALQAKAWTPTQTYDDTGEFCVGQKECIENPGHAAYGVVTLSQALTHDDDVFLYHLGAELNSTAPNGGRLQQTARALGIGRRTGIDLPGETAGLLPTPRSLEQRSPKLRWSELDNVTLAAGQGDLAVTPLQLAVAYAAIARGGTFVTPRIAAGFTSHGSATGLPAPATHRVPLSATALAAVRQGLEANAGSPHTGVHPGVTADVFSSLHKSIAGSVGTSQVIQHGRTYLNGWYAGYIHAAGRSLVVVVLIQGDGFGAVAAAPVARQLFSQWADGRPGRFIPGASVAR